MLLGIELVTDRERKTPADDAARIVLQRAERDGLILQLRGVGGHRNVLRLVPPMTTSDDEVDRAIAILVDALEHARSTVTPG